jgi:hypothetical protein
VKALAIDGHLCGDVVDIDDDAQYYDSTPPSEVNEIDPSAEMQMRYYLHQPRICGRPGSLLTQKRAWSRRKLADLLYAAFDLLASDLCKKVAR